MEAGVVVVREMMSESGTEREAGKSDLNEGNPTTAGKKVNEIAIVIAVKTVMR